MAAVTQARRPSGATAGCHPAAVAAVAAVLAVTGDRLWPVLVVAGMQAVLRQVNDPASFGGLGSGGHRCGHVRRDCRGDVLRHDTDRKPAGRRGDRRHRRRRCANGLGRDHGAACADRVRRRAIPRSGCLQRVPDPVHRVRGRRTGWQRIRGRHHPWHRSVRWHRSLAAGGARRPKVLATTADDVGFT